MVKVAARLRIQPGWDRESTTTATSLRTLARRTQSMTAEAAEAADLERQILAIVRAWRPDLLDQPGIGPIVAATVLCAWSQPGRVLSEPRSRCSPGPRRSRPTAARCPPATGSTATATASSTAPNTIALSRQRYRRTTDGKTPREIRRCLKRYIARDLYQLLERGPTRLDKP